MGVPRGGGRGYGRNWKGWGRRYRRGEVGSGVRATNVRTLLSSVTSLSPAWKVRARVAAKEDTKGRSPLAWNLTLHRRVLSAARSRDTAISGVVNSRILNGTLTDTPCRDEI